jgi:glutamate dehydrogenase
VPPAGVVAHEADDPYLVVAADKGTATFSDIANGLSEDYGFWLGDAFASGGSVGYDHKVMGITARGAWEAVKRHFRDAARISRPRTSPSSASATCRATCSATACCCRRHIRLVAAFDHRHIFIDPNPDATSSWAERKRMFELPRSSWEDYDRSRISAGGGVFPRGQVHCR